MSAASSGPLPTSPPYAATPGGVVGGAASTGESPELILEYWNPKGQKEKVHKEVMNSLNGVCIV